MLIADEQRSDEPLRGFPLIEPISWKDGQSLTVKLLIITFVVLATEHKEPLEGIQSNMEISMWRATTIYKEFSLDPYGFDI